MSILGKLVSSAITIGTAAAVGYGIKKLGEKIEAEKQPEPVNDDNEIIGEVNPKLTLNMDSENEWSYKMSNKGIVKGSSSENGTNSKSFDFVPLKDGVTEIDFAYKPKGSDTASKSITYNIKVKNGKIVRCDAAGDLEMINKKSE